MSATGSGPSAADPLATLGAMAMPHFRAGVIIVVRRADGSVLAFERRDVPGQWQLPQGGIEQGETITLAAWR